MNYKQIRQSANLSLSEIAAFLGVGARMVRYYESGDRVPSGSVQRLYSAIEGNSPDFRAWLKSRQKDGKG